MSSVVVPIYKKEKSAQAFLARAEPVLEHLASYEIIFARSTLRRYSFSSLKLVRM